MSRSCFFFLLLLLVRVLARYYKVESSLWERNSLNKYTRSFVDNLVTFSSTFAHFVNKRTYSYCHRCAALIQSKYRVNIKPIKSQYRAKTQSQYRAKLRALSLCKQGVYIADANIGIGCILLAVTLATFTTPMRTCIQSYIWIAIMRFKFYVGTQV